MSKVQPTQHGAKHASAHYTPDFTHEPYHEPERGQWGSQIEFILACVGYAVGLGNVWRFPYLCFENGGASFLIPYWISLVLAGLPIFYLELSVGQFSSLGANKLYEKLCPIFTGVGWAMVTVSFTVSIYYNVIIAWTLLYFVLSFRGTMMWDTCVAEWNSAHCFSDRNLDYCRQTYSISNNTDVVFFNKTCYFDDTLQEGESLYNDYFEVKKHMKTPPAEEFFNQYVYGLPVADVNNTEFEQGFEYGLGGLRWRLVVSLTVAWIIIFLCLIKGVASTGKVVYFTATFPYVVLVVLFFRGITLDGAGLGINFYVNPEWPKLLSPETWRQAATQIFYSLGPGFGSLLTMASYNKFNNNCHRDALFVAIVNCLTSLFAGFAVFSTIGFLAMTANTPIEDVVKSGPGLAFIVYPEAIVRMPFPPIWAILFFFMVFTLGLDSQFAMVETITTAFMDQFPVLRKTKWAVIGVACIVMYLIGLPMCLDGGIFVFTLFDSYSATYCLLLIAICEFVVVFWVYGIRRWLGDLELMLGSYKGNPCLGVVCMIIGPTGWYWLVTWGFVAPVIILVIFILSMIELQQNTYNGHAFTYGAEVGGYLLGFLPVAMIPAFAIVKLVKYARGYYPDGWRQMFNAHDHWCPAEEREQKKIRASQAMQLNDVSVQYNNKS